MTVPAYRNASMRRGEIAARQEGSLIRIRSGFTEANTSSKRLSSPRYGMDESPAADAPRTPAIGASRNGRMDLLTASFPNSRTPPAGSASGPGARLGAAAISAIAKRLPTRAAGQGVGGM